MKNRTLIAYYSSTGSNAYLAKSLASKIGADTEAIRPRVNWTWLLMLFSLIRMSFGIRKLKHDPSNYDLMVICGPIWMGQLISPLRDAIRKYSSSVEKMAFLTCCASTDEEKDSKYGYARVFEKAKAASADKINVCEAFPVGLVLEPDQAEDAQVVMNTRLSDENFRGEIADRLDRFAKRVGTAAELLQAH